MKKKGKKLNFISWIKRDGSGTEPIEKDMSYFDETKFKMSRLSLSNDTWVASGFNSYVVKLKPNSTNSSNQQIENIKP